MSSFLPTKNFHIYTDIRHIEIRVIILIYHQYLCLINNNQSWLSANITRLLPAENIGAYHSNPTRQERWVGTTSIFLPNYLKIIFIIPAKMFHCYRIKPQIDWQILVINICNLVNIWNIQMTLTQTVFEFILGYVQINKSMNLISTF